jgi:hypothetical protein
MLIFSNGIAATRLAESRALADRLGLREQLEQQIRLLERYGCPAEDPDATRCTLYPDFAPHSFDFTIEKRRPDGAYESLLHGGLIYHGPHDGFGSGGAPTFSVSLNATQGWLVHT